MKAASLFSKFLNTITAEDRDGWRKAYPACDLDIELAKMAEWIKGEPAKGRKKNYRRFVTGWLSRTQDRGGTRTAATPAAPKLPPWEEAKKREEAERRRKLEEWAKRKDDDD